MDESVRNELAHYCALIEVELVDTKICLALGIEDIAHVRMHAERLLMEVARLETRARALDVNADPVEENQGA